MTPVGVFVSYNHKDKIIADAVVQALSSISTRLSVFIDHSGLEGGDEYEGKLSKSIQAAQWFIIICSGAPRPGKDMNWCFYEAGQFRAKLEAENQASSVRSRMCYLYDGDMPSQLARYHGTNITPFDRMRNKLNLDNENDDSLDYEDTELFDLLKLIIAKSADEELRDLADQNTRQLMRGAVRRITRAFMKNRIDDIVEEIVFQPRISFTLPPPVDGNSTGLTPDTRVVGEQNTLKTIFGIAEGSAKWSDIKRSSASITDFEALWISDIEAATRDVAQAKVPAQTEGLCVSFDHNFYRPVIARYEKYRSDAKNCYIAFIPTRDRRFSNKMRTSLILSGLILSVRFRQRVLPIISDLKSLSQDASAKRMDLLIKFQKEVTAIEMEAVEFGLSVPKDEHDEPALLDGFRDGDLKERLRADIREWSRLRGLIFDKIAAARSPDKELSPSDAARFLVEELGDLRDINGRFINAICTELLYLEQVEAPK
jgi:TIR domain